MKYIDLPIPELYDLRADPGEARNLVGAQPDTVERLRRLLDDVRSADRGTARTSEDSETRERLRSLGYLASSPGSGPERYGIEDDPKRLIAYDDTLHELTARYLDGDVAGALALCRKLVRRRPDTPLWLMHLALLERDSGNLEAAVDALRRVVALTPDDQDAFALLGAYLTEAGRARDAADLLEAHAGRQDVAPELLTARSLALARLGRHDEALATMRTARERNPSNAMTLVEMGTIHLMRGDRDDARRAFQAALSINPRAARAHSSLGVLAVEDGRANEAREHWRAATSVDPREHETILGLGIALARAGRSGQARACFEFFVASAPPARYQRDIDRARLWLAQNR
jgi:Flp pilus assembly protein TadD